MGHKIEWLFKEECSIDKGHAAKDADNAFDYDALLSKYGGEVCLLIARRIVKTVINDTEEAAKEYY
jgi:hypothetical protein